jgi:UDP-galactopyranose mutase
MFDYLIVGAGFAGSVLAERLASQLGKRVLLCDKRPHIGGSAYDHFDDAGLLVHKYGPRVFHTGAPTIFRYLSQFTNWRSYEHRVLASVSGKLVPFPINVDTINQLDGTTKSPEEVEKYLDDRAEKIAHPRSSEEAIVGQVGRELYELFFRGYARKQLGLDPSELDASVASRVMARTTHDDRYFTDEFQAMPLRGYTRLFENMLDNDNITIALNTDYRDLVDDVRFDQMIYTGPIDSFFDYRFGNLPYRSLEFKFETHDKEVFQPAATVNYPNDNAYTRITEFKYLTGQTHPKTTVVYEFPCADGDPYYPVRRPENAEIYRRYKSLADKMANVRFVGRLATYRDYDMGQVVGQSLAMFDQIRGAQPETRAA